MWNYTAWATNFVDPARIPVRILLVVLVLLSLVMAASIPEALATEDPQFAIALAAMQVVRPLFIATAMRGQQIGRNFAHLLAWSTVAACAPGCRGSVASTCGCGNCRPHISWNVIG